MTSGIATGGLTALGTLGSSGIVEEAVPFADPVNPTEQKTNLFYQADLFVNKIRNEVALIPITYKRGALEIEICATPAMTVFRYTDAHRISIRKESRDYIINVSDLIFGAVMVIPEPTDIIIEETLLERFTYEVGAWNGEPSWKYSGAYRQGFRVHTKLIDKEDI